MDGLHLSPNLSYAIHLCPLVFFAFMLFDSKIADLEKRLCFFVADGDKNYPIVKTLVWVMNLFGIFFVMAGHEHYSIDVFIAFYLTTRFV